MAVHFTATQRVDPRDQQAPRKYYPRVISSGEMPLKKLTKRIAQMSTLSSGDVLCVLDVLVQVMREELAQGRMVRAGELGTFYISQHASASNTAEEVTASSILSSHLLFKPGEDLKEMLKTIQYKKLH